MTTCCQAALLIYAIGAPIAAVLNLLMLIGSGGYVSRPLAIVRNALLWPVMLPLLFGMQARQ